MKEMKLLDISSLGYFYSFLARTMAPAHSFFILLGGVSGVVNQYITMIGQFLE